MLATQNAVLSDKYRTLMWSRLLPFLRKMWEDVSVDKLQRRKSYQQQLH